MFHRPSTAVFALMLVTGTCPGSDDPDSIAVLRNVDPLDDTPGIEAPARPDRWDIRLGLVGAVHPDYIGSNDYETGLAPYFRINWKDRIVLSGRSVRARIFNNGRFSAGPLARLRGGRDEDDNDDLDGLGNGDRAIEVGGFMRYRTGPWRLRLNAVQDVADGHNGTVVEISTGLQVPAERPWVLLTGKTTWADQNYTDSYFGVSATQARRSGLPAFRPSAGIRDVGLSLASQVKLWRELSLVGVISYERLLGDAADSPLTQQVGDANQLSANVGLVYRF